MNSTTYFVLIIFLALTSVGASLWVARLRGTLRRRLQELTAINESLTQSLKTKEGELQSLQDRGDKKNDDLEKTKRAIMNILEDIQFERNQLSRLTARFTLATQSASIGVFDYELAHQLITLDQIAATLYGLDNKEITIPVDNIISAVAPEDAPRLKQAIENSLEQKTLLTEEFAVIIKGVGPRYLRSFAQPEYSAEGQPTRMVGVVIDISAERAAERLKDEFISLASHQLRTPLTGMKWATELLLKKRDTLTKEQATYLDRILQSETRMVNLVNGLLNISRLDSGVLEIKPESINLNELVTALVSDFSLVTEQSGLKLVMNVPSDPIKANIDRGIFLTIIENLVSNSIKYTPRGGQVTITLSLTPESLTVKISDTGVGIPREQQKRIFEKFFRADNAKGMPVEGTGLGLYVSRSMAEQSGGHLTFTSEEGQGTTFVLEYPVTGMKEKAGTKQLAETNLHLIS